jgi:hypothetical protein
MISRHARFASRWGIAIVVCILHGAAALHGQGTGGGDFFDFARLKNYQAYRSSSNNPDWGSNDDSKRPIPGETAVLADLAGPGVVTHVWVTVASSEYGWPRLLRLRIYYDGSPTPSVDAPLGDFFAVGHGVERPVASTMIRNGSSGRSRNSYWPMPFRSRCRITITNEGRRRVNNLYYHVDWRKVPRLDPGLAYFHAHYRQEIPARMGRRYEILNVKGRGHYAGTVLSVVQREPGWFGEGDEFVTVDGAAKPSIEGTGTEDYFNDAWSFRVSDSLYTGVPIAEGTGQGARLGAYRWHVPDPIPFRTSLRFEIEHAGWTYTAAGAVKSAFEERADLFSSVAFWYQQGIAQGLDEPPYGSARLPHGNARQIEAETLNGVKTEHGTPEVQREVFWGRDLMFLRADGAGSRLDLPFDVDSDGEYELLAQLAHAPDYGVYRVLLDGKPLTGGPLEHEPGANMGEDAGIDTWFNELYVAEDHVLGWRRLDRGRHVVSFVCTGKNTASSGYNLGVDTIILSRVAHPMEPGGEPAAAIRKAVQRSAAIPSAALARGGLADADPAVREAAAWAYTQMPGAAVARVVESLIQMLAGDASPVARGLAALAIRRAGKAAPAAVIMPQLIASLKDPDENVRIAAADTIAARGREAAPALRQLIDACNAPGQHVHVLRSLAGALGGIGPQAAPALPVLEKLAAIPRVEWAAKAAIRSIRP